MPSRNDTARFAGFRAIGCIACRTRGVFSQADVHHLLSGGRRRGHQFTVPLCPYHHRGQPPDGVSMAEANRYYGPSLARAPKSFRAEFGDDETLLATTNTLLERLQ